MYLQSRAAARHAGQAEQARAYQQHSPRLGYWVIATPTTLSAGGVGTGQTRDGFQLEIIGFGVGTAVVVGTDQPVVGENVVGEAFAIAVVVGLAGSL